MSYTHAYSTSCNYSQPIKMLVGVLKRGELVNYKNFTAGFTPSNRGFGPKQLCQNEAY